jgi:hypothetical protein
METAAADGRRYAAAAVPPDRALADDAAPKQFIDGATEQRKDDIKAASARGQTPARERVKTVLPRRTEARKLVRALKRRCASLLDQIGEASRRAAELRAELDHAIDDMLTRLSQIQRGYFERFAVVAGPSTAVGAFDAGIAHAVVEYAGFSAVVVWATTVTVPFAIVGINHALGLLAGAIGERTPEDDLRRLAVMAFCAAFLAALASFGLLMIFRATAAHSQNEALRSLIAGDVDTKLTFFVSPLWMGPLQVCGSMSVIVLTALWTMAKPGREQRKLVIDPLQKRLDEADAEVRQLVTTHRQTTAELEEAELLEDRIEADGLAAQVQVEQMEKACRADVAAVDGSKEAAKARYGAAYESHDPSPPWRMRRPSATAATNGNGHHGRIDPRIVRSG